MFPSKSRIALAVALTLAGAAPAFAGGINTVDYFNRIQKLRQFQPNPQENPWVSVKVKNLSVPAHQITISHGPIPKISMPSMSMTFQVADTTHLAMLHKGDKVDIQLENKSGTVEVTNFRMNH
jgi:Cu/Ag efflux protein CusF